MKKVKVSWDETVEEDVEVAEHYYANVYYNGKDGVEVHYGDKFITKEIAYLNGRADKNFIDVIPVNKNRTEKRKAVKRKTLSLVIPGRVCIEVGQCPHINCEDCFCNYNFLMDDHYKNLKIEEITD